MDKRILSLVPLFGFAIGCASGAPRTAAHDHSLNTRRPAQADVERCWRELAASTGDVDRYAQARNSCGTEVEETFDVRVDAATSRIFTHVVFYRWNDEGERVEVSGGPYDAKQLRAYLDAVRRDQKVTSVPFIDGQKIEFGYKKISVIGRDGQPFELDSMESVIARKGKDCLTNRPGDDSEECDRFSGDFVINWIYDSVINYALVESWEGAKFDGSTSFSAKWEGRSARPLKDITEIAPEDQILAALKNDWIVRNSNVWDQVKSARTLKEFVSKLPKEEYGDGRRFQSHSIRLNPVDRKKAIACATARSNGGIACLRRNKVIIYDYSIAANAISSGFSVVEATPDRIRLAVPFSWGSATEVMRFDVKRSAPSYVHFVTENSPFLGGEFARYTNGRCKTKVMGEIELAEVSRPPLMAPGSCR